MVQSGQIIFVSPKSEEEQKLNHIIESTGRELLRISTTFPFDLFPDQLVIDEDKVNIITKEFIGSEQIFTIPIKEIGDITVDIIPFFGTLKITDNRYKDAPISIKYFKKDDALKAGRIIQGLIKGMEKGIDFSKIDTSSLIKKLETLGKIT